MPHAESVRGFLAPLAGPSLGAGFSRSPDPGVRVKHAYPWLISRHRSAVQKAEPPQQNRVSRRTVGPTQVGLSLLAQLFVYPCPGDLPIPLRRFFGYAENARDLLEGQASEEFQFDHIAHSRVRFRESA